MGWTGKLNGRRHFCVVSGDGASSSESEDGFGFQLAVTCKIMRKAEPHLNDDSVAKMGEFVDIADSQSSETATPTVKAVRLQQRID